MTVLTGAREAARSAGSVRFARPVSRGHPYGHLFGMTLLYKREHEVNQTDSGQSGVYQSAGTPKDSSRRERYRPGRQPLASTSRRETAQAGRIRPRLLFGVVRLVEGYGLPFSQAFNATATSLTSSVVISYRMAVPPQSANASQLSAPSSIRKASPKLSPCAFSQVPKNR